MRKMTEETKTKMKSEMFKRFCLKITSARWIFAVAAAYTFVYLSCTQKMPIEDVKLVIGVVVTFYFTKARYNGYHNGNGNGIENGKA